MLSFDQIYNSFDSIEFNLQWKNGTGYLDHSVKGEHAPSLAVGEVRTFQDDKSRKGFIIGTPCGNVVVFQRYSDGARGIWVMNTSSKANAFIGPDYGSAFGEELTLKLVGYYQEVGSIIKDYNIGKRMNEFMTL